MNWQEIISDFNDGDTWALKYFNNDYDDFFAVLKSKKLFHLLDPLANDSREWQNQYFIWTMENDKQEFYKYMNRILGDVQIDEKGDAYLILDDRKELATLFCDSSRDFSRDTIENILGEDNDWFEYYSETTDDVHRDVVEELNQENLKTLYKKIIDDLKNERVETETEELELIASEQGHPDYVEVNESNIARIVDDRDTFNELMKKYLDIEGDLYRIHSDAYNSAYESQIYKNIMNELGDYFYEGEWISSPHPYKKDTMKYQYKMKIKDFEGQIYDFLHNKYSNAIEDEAYFIRILDENNDCLYPRISDYPDSREVDKNINMYFSDFF
jgi:hypothetical protein